MALVPVREGRGRPVVIEDPNSLPEGTKVVCIDGNGGSFITGAVYEVGGAYWASRFTDHPLNRWIYVQAGAKGKSNGWSASNFELVGGPW